MNAFAPSFFAFVQSVSSDSKLRMAPTPSGFLHVGNALNFSLNWLAAKYCGRPASGRSPAAIFLRIDDLDNDRKRPEYMEDVLETMQWLGLDWDQKPVLQSTNLDRYERVLEQLREQELLFACRKSRKELEPFGGAYPVEFRTQNCGLDDPDVAWRIKTPAGFPLPDFIVRRRDGIPAYQLASFADDLEMGITHIIRGADLETSTQAQIYLAEALSAANFLKIKFLHHPLLLDSKGEKLSKSAGADALKSMRAAGEGPESVFQLIGSWLDLEGGTKAALLSSMQAKCP